MRKNKARILLLNQYSIIKELGRGSHGTVFLAEDSNKQQYAIKSVLRKGSADALYDEINVMKTLDKHPNLVFLHEVIDDLSSSRLYMVIEYVSGGCVIPENKLISEPIPTVFSPLKIDRCMVLLQRASSWNHLSSC